MPVTVGCNEWLGLTDKRLPRKRATLRHSAPTWLFSPSMLQTLSKGTALARGGHHELAAKQRIEVNLEAEPRT